jgi:hypothetical protein
VKSSTEGEKIKFTMEYVVMAQWINEGKAPVIF